MYSCAFIFGIKIYVYIGRHMDRRNMVHETARQMDMNGVNEWPDERINIHLINEYLCLIYAKVRHLIGCLPVLDKDTHTIHPYTQTLINPTPIQSMIHHWVDGSGALG